MARKPKKQAPQAETNKAFDEFADDSEGLEDDVAVDSDAAGDAKLRDWRDVEKYKEERALRRMIDDDLDFDAGGGRRRREG